MVSGQCCACCYVSIVLSSCGCQAVPLRLCELVELENRVQKARNICSSTSTFRTSFLELQASTLPCIASLNKCEGSNQHCAPQNFKICGHGCFCEHRSKALKPVGNEVVGVYSPAGFQRQ
ncbi:uncharacterized protein IWZ02DRAFT_240709 [Phyllosticta citriasiana]|uniref:uncharacterized protein n=1 Tax=Phyllosticta citriasiana TaxID=595635 RepID=UPI0030FD3401